MQVETISKSTPLLGKSRAMATALSQSVKRKAESSLLRFFIPVIFGIYISK